MKGGNFQIIIIVVFIAAAIFGVLVFSGAIPIGQSEEGSLGTVVLWGTFPSQAIVGALDDFNDANTTFKVEYVQKSSSTFDRDLLEALASGRGPDIFFLPDNLALNYSDKIFTIPYSNYSLSTFKNVFAGAGEVFLTNEGILAFPISIDPLMLYYNRSLLDSNGIIYPPNSWDDLVGMVPALTKRDESGKINKSAVALGQFSNVVHAKDIISAMLMQTGNPIVKREGKVFNSAIDTTTGGSSPSDILRFYTSFADPNNAVYSWNKSFVDSGTAFSREDLAFYFGFASELQSLVNRNPNQNFFVTAMPQIKNGTFKVTGARVTGLAISSFSKNFNTAFIAVNLLSTSDFAYKLSTALNIAPARRDLLAIKMDDAYTPYFYSSALFGKSWLDPSPKDTDNIWSGMVNAVLSNNMSPEDAIKDASSKLQLLLFK